MARHYQDFVGLNTFIYEPNGWSIEDQRPAGLFGFEEITYGGSAFFKQNEIGYRHLLEASKNYLFPFDLPTTASFFNALMSHRGNVYGYPTWRQIRVSNNPLTRKQRKNNIFTYVQEPGPFVNNRPARYGSINVFREPVVIDSNKPLSLVGDVSVYDSKLDKFQNRTVELRTSFGNETAFFANQEINEYFDTTLETDDNYEELKELYLDGGLEDDGSPIEAFNLLVYRQSVFPKQQYSYLNKTRSRTFFANTFWRDEREQRTQTDVDTGFGSTVPSQSMWPLDVAEDWATREEPNPLTHTDAGVNYKFYSYYIGGESGSTPPNLPGNVNVGAFNTGDETGFSPSSLYPTISLGASGLLVNSYAQFTRGHYGNELTASFLKGLFAPISNFIYPSPYYLRRQSNNSTGSVVSPSGMYIEETGSLTTISTGSLFEGVAAWDCGRLAGKQPFYDSYDKYSEEVRLVGKGFSIVPEFRISSHVEEYLTKGVTEELRDIFEISGGLSQHSTTESESNFYEVLSTSDFLKHFDLIKKDHKDFAKESILTLKCKALKKFLPYEGFYPAQQTVEIAKEFKNAIVDDVRVDSLTSQVSTTDLNIGIQGVLEPLFAPGVLFNAIKSGVAVDYPIVLPEDNPVYLATDYEGDIGTVSGFSSHRYNYYLAGSDLAPFDPSETQASALDRNLNSIWSKRIDFESLVEPERLLANLEFSLQEPHPFGLREDYGDLKFKWGGKQKITYKKKISNFLAEVAETFLDNSSFTTIVSDEEKSPNFGNAVAGNYYTMRIKMSRSRNKNNEGYEGFRSASVVPPQDLYHQDVRENFTMYSRPSAFGYGVWGSQTGGDDGDTKPLDPLWGSNYCFTPPYYHGESWCDLIFYANETKKYTLEEIISGSSEYPYYTRFWHYGVNDALRDLTGYRNDAGKKYPAGDYSQTFTGAFSDWSNSTWADLVSEDTSGIYFKSLNHNTDWGYVVPGTENNVPYWTSDLYDIPGYPGNDLANVAPATSPSYGQL